MAVHIAYIILVIHFCYSMLGAFLNNFKMDRGAEMK